MAITKQQWANASRADRAAMQEKAQAARMLRLETRLKWYGERVANNIKIGLSARVRLAAQLVRDRAVINLSRPVTKIVKTRPEIDPKTGKKKWKRYTVVDPKSRSKPGEFPRADTTRLMKDVFHAMEAETSAIVGTSLVYGLILETKRDRSFLVRTLNEMMPTIRQILVGKPL